MDTADDQRNTLILSTAVFPPVEYFVYLAAFEEVWIEADENFNKQTYRNRFVINAANGPLSLVIPVKREHGRKTKITKAGVDYDIPWPREYWRSVFAAYNNSPFFLFYQDEIDGFLNRKFDSLFEMNLESIRLVCDLLQLDKQIKISRDFRKTYGQALDLRYKLHPKKPLLLDLLPWTQVFAEKYGFNPRVSILDLLFNKGPESLIYLKNARQL